MLILFWFALCSFGVYYFSKSDRDPEMFWLCLYYLIAGCLDVIIPGFGILLLSVIGYSFYDQYKDYVKTKSLFNLCMITFYLFLAFYVGIRPLLGSLH